MVVKYHLNTIIITFECQGSGSLSGILAPTLEFWRHNWWLSLFIQNATLFNAQAFVDFLFTCVVESQKIISGCDFEFCSLL